MGLRAGAAPSGRVGYAEPFAVYETEGGYDRRDIRVKIYQAIEKSDAWSREGQLR